MVINMDACVYSRKNYNIYKCKNGSYVVHNTKKPFEYGHTHVADVEIAKLLIKCAIKKRVPDHLSKYLKVSLLRIADDYRYVDRIKTSLRK